MRVVFMGTPDFAVPTLEALIENHEVVGVVTQPDKRKGRGKAMAFSPVKEKALEHEIPVYQPVKVREEAFVQILRELDPEVIVVAAFGQILPESILNMPKYGCINVHGSLLPKLRGGAPIHRAIMNGYKKTGITIMYMNAKMDEGYIISSEEIEIEKNDTASTLHDKLSKLGEKLLLKTLPSIIDGTNDRIKQNSDDATYAFVIKREDEKIDFSKTKREIYNKVRGLNSWPGAYAIFDSKILKVWECYETENFFPELLEGQNTKVYKDGIGVKVSNGEIVLTVVQPEGKGKMKAVDFARGLVNKGALEGRILS